MEQQEAALRIESPELVGRRVDQVIAESELPLTRSKLKSVGTEILCNGRPTKASYTVRIGDLITVRYVPEPESEIEPEAVEFGILYEDEHVMVVNKPRGLVVHPGAGTREPTLAHGLLHHYVSEGEGASDEQAFSDTDGGTRAGIVHRLDKDTSGVLITAKNSLSLEALQKEFAERRAEKLYLAICVGVPPKRRAIIDDPIIRHPRQRTLFTTTQRSGGRSAETAYRVVRVFSLAVEGTVNNRRTVRKGGKSAEIQIPAATRDYSLLALTPKTGRTHQLRVHLKSIGCPILGDPLYAKPDSYFPNASLMLHAYSLGIYLPHLEQKRVFRASVPDDMFAMIRRLREADSVTAPRHPMSH